jgi:Lar family restriction alleviation protein
MSEKLLPCPFCGSTDVECSTGYQGRTCDENAFRYVECGSCEASVGWAKDDAVAIAAWNRRTPESSVPAPLDPYGAIALEKALPAIRSHVWVEHGRRYRFTCCARCGCSQRAVRHFGWTCESSVPVEEATEHLAFICQCEQKIGTCVQCGGRINAIQLVPVSTDELTERQ